MMSSADRTQTTKEEEEIQISFSQLETEQQIPLKY